MASTTTEAARLRAILIDRREKKKLDQIEVARLVAELLGMDSLTKQTISQWETGRTKRLGIDEFGAWAEALGMSLHVDLFDPADQRHYMRVRTDLVEAVSRLHDVPAEDLETVIRVIRRFSLV